MPNSSLRRIANDTDSDLAGLIEVDYMFVVDSVAHARMSQAKLSVPPLRYVMSESYGPLTGSMLRSGVRRGNAYCSQ